MNTKKGFTLIELLVVISIIAMLMTILIPSLQKAQMMGKILVCQSNVRQFGTASLLYRNENNDNLMPYIWSQNGNTPEYFWMETFRKYYGDIDEIKFCPMAKKASPKSLTETGKVQSQFGTAKQAWHIYQYDNDMILDEKGSYGINAWVRKPTESILNHPSIGIASDKSYYYVKAAGIREAYNVPLILDSVWVDGWVDDDLTNLPLDGTGERLNTSMSRFCIDRHSKLVNSCFIDGSVRKVKLEELWSLKWHKKFDTTAKVDLGW